MNEIIPRGVVANVLDSDIVVIVFEPQWCLISD